MSDQLSPNPFKPPVDLMRQLKEADASLASIRKIIDALKEMGWNTMDMENTYNTVSRSREILMKAFGV